MMKVPRFIGEARSPVLLPKDRSFVCKAETAFVRIRRYTKLCMFKYIHCIYILKTLAEFLKAILPELHGS